MYHPAIPTISSQSRHNTGTVEKKREPHVHDANMIEVRRMRPWPDMHTPIAAIPTILDKATTQEEITHDEHKAII
jgi:hypothetical protein